MVVITCDDAARLPRAVRSVLDQSLRNLEVVIVDDASTDGTDRVARELQREDPRVRYLRRDVNSGGCGAPRNQGTAAARAPFVMFLDSDDRLTRHACKSMLLEAERTGADFVTGQISRLYEASGRTRPYYPDLFARRRTVEGIAREPEMFLDSFSTNKLYRAELLRRLPFREDLHYEDHVFSAELYCAARRFAVVPWVVYLWHRVPAGGPGRPSISLRITDMDNVRHRVRAARLSDDVLRGNGLDDLVPDRRRRFLRQDLRVYLDPLPRRDPAWAAEFAEVVGPYLAEFGSREFAGIDPVVRVCCRLIVAGRADELVVAARSLSEPKPPPRFAVRRDGRTYWALGPPGTDGADGGGRERVPSGEPVRAGEPGTAASAGGRKPDLVAPEGMEITALRMAELPFGDSRLRHEVAVTPAVTGAEAGTGAASGPGSDSDSGTGMSAGGRAGTEAVLTIRTYDPFGMLAANPGWRAYLDVAGHRTRLHPRRRDDGVHVSEVTVDLAVLGRGRPGAGLHGLYGLHWLHWLHGFRELGHDSRVVVVRPDGRSTADPLLTDPGTGPVTAALPWCTVVFGAEGRAGFLRVRRRRRGVLRPAARVARIGRAAVRRAVRRAGDPRVKLRVYRCLIRAVPPRRNLVLFESDVGAGCTGNPRYVYEELLRRRAPFTMVWSVARNRRNFPAGARLVRRMSWRHVWTMARAGYWVDSHGMPLDFPKPARTRYLQTWHGQGIKTVGFDAPDLRADFPGPRARWRAAVARWDALVSPSAEFERIFLPSNGYRGPVLRYGSPRCDVLVRGDDEAVRRVRDELEIPPERKVLLYAPTYRDHAMSSGRSVRADLELMARELAGEWTVVLRPHPVERYAVPRHLLHFVRPAGSYPEVNDLMLASDALLTDYSSLMCDYAVTGRPMLFLIDDWDEYRRLERGVLHDLPAIAPGPCLTTTREVVETLRDLPAVSASFAGRYAEFRALWCAEEKGNAASRVVDAFFGVPPEPGSGRDGPGGDGRARRPSPGRLPARSDVATRVLIRAGLPGRLLTRSGAATRVLARAGLPARLLTWTGLSRFAETRLIGRFPVRRGAFRAAGTRFRRTGR
ncbi:CDP-glycerol glycerophosphotransferase family protein [Streptosporangium sp. NPDC004379]|uniref:bifunctional glycosyltransferase/CDP-glycerol:glycerophosphate glycerophosphotransferase n=1 Tax=Streptosporangium sp. NPDC004379 TaxID=3366189 RepID=UPI0036BC219B